MTLCEKNCYSIGGNGAHVVKTQFLFRVIYNKKPRCAFVHALVHLTCVVSSESNQIK